MRKQLFLAAIPALFLGSCSGSKVLPAESLHMDAATTRDYPSRFYDDHTQIRYDFRNDNQYLYVILETDNPSARMRMLREGVKIYFAPTGSKSEARLVEYPFHPDTEKAPSDQHRAAGAPRQPEAGVQRTDERDYTSFYKQARVTRNGKTELVDATTATPGLLHFKAANDADGFFRYMVSIPKSQLAINKDHTVIGIRIPEMKQGPGTYSGRGEATTHMSAGGGGRGGSMHGGGGGGMRGKGGMYGGGMHNRSAEGSNPNHSKDDVSGKVDWWYKIGLVS
ncbi:hypothetical protein [Niabella sp.]|uniref:hypothetical protein n=1 Tax=Niabella sp. TaxID=1962976 RepID=UPI00263A1F77|nr:hypothetical protein [Niabella sp.]